MKYLKLQKKYRYITRLPACLSFFLFPEFCCAIFGCVGVNEIEEGSLLVIMLQKGMNEAVSFAWAAVSLATAAELLQWIAVTDR